MDSTRLRSCSAVAVALLLLGCASAPKPDETSDWPVDRLYESAKSALRGGDYPAAIALYKTLEARFPYGTYAEQAQIEIAFAHFKNDEPELALAAADRFTRLHPTHPSVDYAYYLKGLISFSEGETGFIDMLTGTAGGSRAETDPQAALDAFNAFRDLATRYPDSRYAADARQRMAFLLNTLARHNLSVARYYMKRGAYVAVVNRAKYVIENYQSTPAVEDALGLMAIAYREMGMNELTDDTLRVLRMNFPESRYLGAFGGS